MKPITVIDIACKNNYILYGDNDDRHSAIFTHTWVLKWVGRRFYECYVCGTIVEVYLSTHKKRLVCPITYSLWDTCDFNIMQKALK